MWIKIILTITLIKNKWINIWSKFYIILSISNKD